MVECDLEHTGLPEKVRRVIPDNKHTLLKSSLVERDHWLVLVRAAQDTIEDYRIQDEFSNLKTSLRKLVGL